MKVDRLATLSLCFALVAACGDDSETPATNCTNSDVREQACGLNGNGAQQEVCQDEVWVEFGTCDDPDVCTDEALQAGSTTCGLNSAGVLEQACEAGAWVDTATCIDPDACTTGEIQPVAAGTACGVEGFEIGVEIETCVAGQWSAEGDCSCGDVPSVGDYTLTTGADLAQLAGVTQITGTLTVSAFAGTDLNGLESLACAGAILFESTALTSLTGLNALTSVGRWLAFNGNTALTSLTGLDALTSVGGYLGVAGNGLTSLTGLDALTYVGEDVYISRNDDLTSLTGLGALTYVGLGFNVYNNAGLTSLTGPDALTSVGLNLYVFNNDDLTTLTGLDALTSVGGDLYVQDNAVLAGIGLSSLADVEGGEFLITDNPDLSTCDATALYERLTTQPATVDVSTGNLAATCM